MLQLLNPSLITKLSAPPFFKKAFAAGARPPTECVWWLQMSFFQLGEADIAPAASPLAGFQGQLQGAGKKEKGKRKAIRKGRKWVEGRVENSPLLPSPPK